MPKIKLTYFNIEGVAEPIRLALALAGQDYEDDRINFADWADMKPKTPYGSLPLMTIDDGPVKTQSSAMLRWVGATCSKTLYPADKLYDIEEAIGVLKDMSDAWSPKNYIGMNPTMYGRPEGFGSTEEGKALIKDIRQEWIAKDLPMFLGRIEGLLTKSGGKWLVAGLDEPTIADCMAVATLRAFSKGHIDHVDPKCLEVNPTIVDYVKRFCDLPAIKGRYDSGVGSPAYE
jgi:glutathione S-transferase